MSIVFVFFTMLFRSLLRVASLPLLKPSSLPFLLLESNHILLDYISNKNPSSCICFNFCRNSL